MCSMDTEPCPVWVETPRTARKAHMCHGCGAEIRPTEAYNEVRYVFDGSAGTERECFACWWTAVVFGWAHGSRSMPQNLWQDLQDCIDGRLPADERSAPTEWAPELAALKNRWRTSPSGRRKLRTKWMRRAVTRSLMLTKRVVTSRKAQLERH